MPCLGRLGLSGPCSASGWGEMRFCCKESSKRDTVRYLPFKHIAAHGGEREEGGCWSTPGLSMGFKSANQGFEPQV